MQQTWRNRVTLCKCFYVYQLFGFVLVILCPNGFIVAYVAKKDNLIYINLSIDYNTIFVRF